MSTPAPKKHLNANALRVNELDIASLLIHADTLGKDEIPVGVPIRCARGSGLLARRRA